MTAEELKQYFHMNPHVEKGSFIECHYPAEGEKRPASGSIYYYVAPGELTEFHVIDCDEYWCHIQGSPLEVWQIAEDGHLTIDLLGTEKDCTPLLYLKKGVIFGSRHVSGESEGTFLSCITVPRFDPQGFRLFSREEIEKTYPQAKAFYRIPGIQP